MVKGLKRVKRIENLKDEGRVIISWPVIFEITLISGVECSD